MTTILLIDNNEDEAVLIRRVLDGRQTYRLFHAKNGRDGINLAQQKKPDVIISNLIMLGMDGLSLVQELRLDPGTKDIPVVLASAKDISFEEREQLNTHAEMIYQKGSLKPWAFMDQVIQISKNNRQGK